MSSVGRAGDECDKPSTPGQSKESADQSPRTGMMSAFSHIKHVNVKFKSATKYEHLMLTFIHLLMIDQILKYKHACCVYTQTVSKT